MFKKILKGLFTVLGGALGWLLGGLLLNIEFLSGKEFFSSALIKFIIPAIIAILIGIIFFILSPLFIKHTVRLIEYLEKLFSRIPPIEIVLGALGGLLALTIFFLITNRLLDKAGFIGQFIGIIGNVVAFVLGANIAMKKSGDIDAFISNLVKGKIALPKKTGKIEGEAQAKVLDTSVIIDGRIYDICKSGFMEGPLLIPAFVLEELRHIADSSDSLKRNRGRRGLDILNKMQKELDQKVSIYDRDPKDIEEVDAKLLRVAKDVGGKVVTNDYNLNKVAEFQGVSVLNINELANAVKPILLPGEELTILVSKQGKEYNQGIAYLDDGTMIVIENGKKYLGQEKDVIVTSVLQTAAGRMIFARPKEEMENL